MNLFIEVGGAGPAVAVETGQGSRILKENSSPKRKEQS